MKRSLLKDVMEENISDDGNIKAISADMCCHMSCGLARVCTGKKMRDARSVGQDSCSMFTVNLEIDVPRNTQLCGLVCTF